MYNIFSKNSRPTGTILPPKEVSGHVEIQLLGTSAEIILLISLGQPTIQAEGETNYMSNVSHSLSVVQLKSFHVSLELVVLF